MLAKEIHSLQHPIVKRFVKLRTNRKTRYEERAVVISGIKQVGEASALKTLLVEKNFIHNFKAGEIYSVNQDLLKKITGMQSPEPVCALVEMPPFQDLKLKQKIIALDGIRDPGNLGTLLRTALALGIEGCFLFSDCADPFNDKSLRAGMGAALGLPLQIGSEDDLIDLAKEGSFAAFVADMKGDPFDKLTPPKKTLLILGNEARGVSDRLKQTFQTISIPIKGIESLNVAAAGAILMYYLSS